MKKLLNKNSFFFNELIILFFLIFAISCVKQTNPTNPTKPISPTNPTGPNIIYTDVNPDSIILAASIDSFNLDLNNDGIIDFAFTRESFLITCSDIELGLSGNYTRLSVVPTGSNAIITPLLALDSSAAIISDSMWATTSQILVYGMTSGSGRCTLGPAGHWYNVSDKYLGLKLIKNNNTYYGWARLSSSFALIPSTSRMIKVGQLILKDYAFNSIPNQQILAGQTK